MSNDRTINYDLGSAFGEYAFDPFTDWWSGSRDRYYKDKPKTNTGNMFTEYQLGNQRKEQTQRDAGAAFMAQAIPARKQQLGAINAAEDLEYVRLNPHTQSTQDANRIQNMIGARSENFNRNYLEPGSQIVTKPQPQTQFTNKLYVPEAMPNGDARPIKSNVPIYTNGPGNWSDNERPFSPEYDTKNRIDPVREAQRLDRSYKTHDRSQAEAWRASMVGKQLGTRDMRPSSVSDKGTPGGLSGISSNQPANAMAGGANAPKPSSQTGYFDHPMNRT